MPPNNSGRPHPPRRRNTDVLDMRLPPPKYKSLGEEKIAKLLKDYGIPFIYEKPVAVQDDGKTKLWYPDFYLFCGVLIEYFGVRDDPAYDKRTEHKLAVYARNGLSVIPVYPEDLNNHREDWLLARVDESLEQKLSAYRIAVAQHQERHRRLALAQYMVLR